MRGVGGPDGWVNPARAGMIPGAAAPASGGPRKPRASGDDPVLAGMHRADQE